ncbi:MAG: TIGR01620 family protein [Pseudorhodobacter sp.]|nr:TIGR01620 family protein [Pseudorhodobacter sp.]
MNDDLPRLKRPLLVDREDEVDPSLAEAVPELADGRAMQAVALLATRRGSAFGRFATWVFGALFSFVVSVWAWNFVIGLFAANSVLGGVALALVGLALLVALVVVVRELSAFSRLKRLDLIRAEAVQVALGADIKAARVVFAQVTQLYAGRAELAWGHARLVERQAEVMDADALLALAEAELLAPLDALALREVEEAARRVATVTALVPLALADLVTALVSNLRMIRRVAEIYGGRSGALGSWRLLRRVFVALVATGAVALTDDMLGSFAGGGLLSKLSRRFGEGVVNGALTVRVGLAAMDLCRPLPWIAKARPSVSATVSRALAGMFGR